MTKLNEVLTSKRSFISDRMNSVGILFAFFINIIHWLILFIKIKPNEDELLLHYNVVYGADLIGKSLYLYWIPALALILLVVNIIFAVRFYSREKLASYFLNLSNIPVQLVFLVGTVVIILANE